MGDTFKQSMSKTMRMADEYIKPILPRMIRGQLIPVEGKTDDELYEILDRLGGIDYFGIDKYMPFGVASRIQPGRRWDTFTVRKSRDSGTATEFEKRCKALDGRGYVFPRITYQAYVSRETGGKLLSMAVCLTEQLIRFCIDGKAATRHTSQGQIGGAEFFVCPWMDMINSGCVMRIYDSKDGSITLYNMTSSPIVECIYP